MRLGFDPGFGWQVGLPGRTIGLMTTEQEQDGALPPQAMLTVAAVARRLGVAPSTLRTWDRRYGLGPSAHTAGSHRRYSPADVSRLVVMRGLVVEGVPPAEAAQIALGSEVMGDAAVPLQGLGGAVGEVSVPPVTGVPALRRAEPGLAAAPTDGELSAPEREPVGHEPVGEGSGKVLWPATPLAAEHLLQSVAARPAPETLAGGEGALDPVFDAALARAVDEAFGRVARPVAPFVQRPAELVGRVTPAGRHGGGKVISLPDASPRARGLARAAMSLDTHEVARLMGDAVEAYGIVATWETMILPVLRGLGERWQVTGEGIDVEHAFSEATMGVLRGLTAGLRRPRNARPVLLACADGDQHTLPLHVLAAVLAETGVGSRVLGVGMPSRSLVAAIRRTGPAAVFVYARMPVPDATVLREIPRQRPAPRVLVGGPGWQYVDVPSAVVSVDSLDAAADAVRSALHL